MSESLDLQNLEGEAEKLAASLGPGPEVEAAQQAQQVAEIERESAGEEWAGVLSMVLMPATQILAPNWHITNAEIDQLSQAYGAVLAELFPDVAQAGPWVGAIAVTGMVVAPRIGIPRTLPPKKSPEKPEAKPEGAENGA